MRRGDRIGDFVKARGDGTSYGAFFKGSGSNNRLERNVVVCEHKLRPGNGRRVGLSFGGGGSQPRGCRDRKCITEHDHGVIEANLIAHCSDDGIYINRAATSRVLHNTLIDTGGIVVRFVESSAEVQGNLVDGSIRARDGGVLHAGDNLDTSLARLYLGSHPVRDLFIDALALDLRWRSGAPPRRPGSVESVSVLDLCAPTRGALATYGAFNDAGGCLNGGNGSAAINAK